MYVTCLVLARDFSRCVSRYGTRGAFSLLRVARCVCFSLQESFAGYRAPPNFESRFELPRRDHATSMKSGVKISYVDGQERFSESLWLENVPRPMGIRTCWQLPGEGLY